MSAKRRVALHAFSGAQRSHRRRGSPSRSTAAASNLSKRTHLRGCCPKFPCRRYPSWEPTASGCDHCRRSRRYLQEPESQRVRLARICSRASPTSWGKGRGYSPSGDRPVDLRCKNLAMSAIGPKRTSTRWANSLHCCFRDFGKQTRLVPSDRRWRRTGMKLPHRRQFLSLIAGAAALPAASSIARAQAYPARPIRLVIPFPPGGAYDAVGRPWADRVKPLLGTVVVENIGGGGSSLGAAAVARARPDGYTILLGGTQTHVNEALLKSRPLYDPTKDLDPIAGVAANALCIAVHPAVPVRTVAELIAYAKANPGKLSYGHSGIGSIQHLTGELFKSLAGTPDIVQVPYRGTGPVITDLVSGQIPMGVPGVTVQVLEFHRSEKMRVLAVTSPKRLIAAPEIPTATELGLVGMNVIGSIGLLAPAGTPVEFIEQIARATRTAVAEPTYQQ